MGAAEAAAVTGSGASGGGGSDALPVLAAAAVDSTADLGQHSTVDDPVELRAENGGGRSKDIEHEASSESAEADEQSTLLQREHQRFGTTGFSHAGLFSKFTYLFVTPLVAMGARNKIVEDSAAAFLPQADTASVLAREFDAAYGAIKAQQAGRARPASPSGLLWRTFWRLYHWRILGHLAWTLIEVACRVGAPLVLRQLLSWFSGWEATDGDTQAYPVWKGWMWAAILGIFGYAYAFVHHQLFWYGMRMGFNMRQQAVAAVQAKVLRLNSVAVADQTAGKIVNLVSNDVRRFDDALPFYNFLVAAPVELLIVFLLVGQKLGYWAALAGVSTLITLIPVQGVLVRYIGRLRAATAAQTDERVRLTGEVVSGMLATKMLGWEQPFLAQISAIRGREARFIRRMARIKAFNMGLSYGITPLSALAAFGVARATNPGELTVANVFYSLALLALPKLYFCDFFTQGVQTMSELRITLRRVGAFLSLPEPPEPWHAKAAAPTTAHPGGAHSSNASASNGTSASSGVVNGQHLQPAGGHDGGHAEDGGDGMAAADLAKDAGADVAVQVAGADFDWSDRSWAEPAASAADPAANTANGAASKADAGVHVAAGQPGSAAAVGAVAGGAASFQLRGLRFSVPHGQLVAIVGAVGSGKSSILAALLGELQPTSARHVSGRGAGALSPVTVRGSVAYCSQVPWIVSGSLKENVLFGRRYDEKRYAAVLRACALEDDVASLPAGSETELGERGINLSGGQKARLALARAAYSRAYIQLLDDPLSAVDPRVGRILFDQCIGNNGLMAGSTRLLVTHQRQFLPGCDFILVLRGGQVAHRGTYAELAGQGVPEVVATQEHSLDDANYDANTAAEQPPSDVSAATQGSEDGGEAHPAASSGSDEEAHPQGSAESAEANDQTGRSKFDRLVSQVFASTERGEKDGALHASESSASRADGPGRLGSAARRWQAKLSGSYLRRAVSARFGARTAAISGDGGADEQGGKQGQAAGKSGRLIVTEDRAVGSVSWAIYGRFAQRMGMAVVILIAAALLLGQAIYLFGDYWLATWASKSPETQRKAYWVWGYSLMVGSILLISFSRSLLFYMSALRASTRLHDEMAARVLHAPLSFFHTSPTGRILNRFSKDQGQVDEQLPQVFFDAVQALMMVLGAFVLLMVVVPFIIPVFLPLGFGFFWVRGRYLATSREVKRWEATSRSPVFASFSAILKGLPTIRAYGAGARFRSSFLWDLSENGAWWFCFLTTARWIGFRLDILVALLMSVAPLLMMAVHSSLSARLAGLALTQSLQLAGLLQWMVRQTAEVENNMTSVERMLHYTELEQEPPTQAQGGPAPPPGWPSAGRIEYRGVSAIYRPGLPPVLRDLSFTLEGGMSCGVVGRTGSGKSSLMLTLFRLIPVTSGSILIDDVDTAGLALDALRRQVAIIPQDPVLFSGTLRSNLDPWGTHDDARLWEALQVAQLGAAVSALGGLDARMQEAGDNLSVGQRQLFCLARALLQDAAVLALDEATANVDRQTDELIQQAVRDCARFGDRRRTMLVIAHRIDTIMDCDRLLVLSAGRLVEHGPPGQLAQSGGMFARLVAAARSSGAAVRH
ncbi:hypothetical protein ABPG77_004473 [Micractinium sp. CCAP 211/92]